jgi:MSHA pilin protein MshA
METSMKSLQKGFTLIELIVVIVILGILAAVALPKFVDLTNEALTASVQGVAGAVSSGSAINYGAFVAGKSGTVTIAGTNAAVCTTATLQQLLTGNAFPSTGSVTYSAIPGATACTGAGTTITCGVQGVKGTTTLSATATVVCTG